MGSNLNNPTIRFQIIKATHFAASEVTPGVLCMFFIRMLVSTANS